MEREIKIYDETNRIFLSVSLDDSTEFLEVWGVGNDNNLVVQRNKHGYTKSPMQMLKPHCWSCGVPEGEMHEKTCCGSPSKE